MKPCSDERGRQRLRRSRRPGARTRGSPRSPPRCSATAMAAVVWLCGPPCRPGKTALSIAVACSAVVMIMAPRGPRRVLCVVVVITSAWPTGDGCAPPAIRPAMWAMSATRTAPTSRAMAAKPGKSMVRGTAVPPQKITLGRSARARSRTSSRSIRPVSRRHAVVDRVEPLAGHGDRPAVRQVAAHRQRHAHHGVARLQERQVDGEVGGRARVGLDVGVVDAEQALGPVDRQRLDRVDELLALVVALARRSPRCICWSARWSSPRAPPRRRSSRTRSFAACRAAGWPRPRSASASSGSSAVRWGICGTCTASS